MNIKPKNKDKKKKIRYIIKIIIILSLIIIGVTYAYYNQNNQGIKKYKGATIYSPEKSKELTQSYFNEHNDMLDPSHLIPIISKDTSPNISNVYKALDNCSYFNQDVFNNLDIYIMSNTAEPDFLKETKTSDVYEYSYKSSIAGLASKDKKIFLFSITAEFPIEQTLPNYLIHELGHIAINTFNINPYDYVKWRLSLSKSADKNKIYRDRMSIEDILAQDFSEIYGDTPLTFGYFYDYFNLPSPKDNDELRKHIKNQLDILFQNQKQD